MELPSFGPGLALLVAAAGGLWFALAPSAGQLTAARAMIGLGVSGCLMSSLTAFALWYPPERMATMNGVAFASGMLGALAATVPLELLLPPAQVHPRRRDHDPPVAGVMTRLTWDQVELTGPFQPNQRYTATVGPAVLNADGEALLSPHERSPDGHADRDGDDGEPPHAVLGELLEAEDHREDRDQ